MKGISSVLQKLLRYFNGTIISTLFVPPFPVCPVIWCLNLNEALLLLSAGKSIIVSLSIRAVVSHKLPVSSNKQHYILLNYE